MPENDVNARVAEYLSTQPAHLMGDRDAPVCVVEYGDYECPYCAGAWPVLRELVSSSEGQVRLIFRNFPLFEVHPHALTAALAAESVAASGGEQAYWLLHEKLFVHQSRLNDFDLQIYAKAVGGDPDLATGEPAQVFAPIVQADYASGIAVGVSGTPTLFIQGESYSGRVDLLSLRRAVGTAAVGLPVAGTAAGTAAASRAAISRAAAGTAAPSGDGARNGWRRPWQRG